LFLARRDPAFFEKHVKPALASKRQPEFLDHYLLGHDLRPWLRPFAWNRLNAAEKTLLARALPEARERILDDLRHRWEREAPPPEAEALLFAQTISNNPSMTAEHAQNTDKVRRGLYTGEGFFNLGKYDEAKREFENVLRVDPFNKAARRWLERIAAAKSDYYRAAYDQTRAELLSQVDSAWKLNGPGDGTTIVLSLRST